MSLFSKFWNRAENNNESHSEEDFIYSLLNNNTVSKSEALSIPAVSQAVEKISNTIAMVDFRLYKKQRAEKGKKVEIIEIFEDKRPRLFNIDTSDTLTGFEFKKALVIDYLLGKGGYAFIDKNKNKVVGLHYIPERQVFISTTNDIVKKNYMISVDNKKYDDYQIFRILRNTQDGSSGKGYTQEISKALCTAVDAIAYQLNLTKSGGVKRGFLTSEHKVDDKAIEKIKKSWRKMYSAPDENIVVLNNGLSFQEATQSPLELQLNNIRDTLDKELKSIFGLDLDDTQFIKYSILPILKIIKTALNRFLLLEQEKEEGYFWDFDTSELSKGSLKEQCEALKLQYDMHAITVNEIRRSLNRSEHAGLDVIDFSLGSVLYDVNTQKYYTPNTGETSQMNGGENK